MSLYRKLHPIISRYDTSILRKFESRVVPRYFDIEYLCELDDAVSVIVREDVDGDPREGAELRPSPRIRQLHEERLRVLRQRVSPHGHRRLKTMLTLVKRQGHAPETRTGRRANVPSHGLIEFLLVYLNVVVIIIIAEMAVFNVTGYLVEERRGWPVITASTRGQYSK